jgi:hypothetical protein
MVHGVFSARETTDLNFIYLEASFNCEDLFNNIRPLLKFAFRALENITISLYVCWTLLME